MITSRLPSAIHALAGEPIVRCVSALPIAALLSALRPPRRAERPARLTADAATSWARTPPRRRDASTPAAPLAAHGP